MKHHMTHASERWTLGVQLGHLASLGCKLPGKSETSLWALTFSCIP